MRILTINISNLNYLYYHQSASPSLTGLPGHLGEDALLVLSECLGPLPCALVHLTLRITHIQHRGVLTLSEKRLFCLNYVSNVTDALIVQEGLVVVLEQTGDVSIIKNLHPRWSRPGS